MEKHDVSMRMMAVHFVLCTHIEDNSTLKDEIVDVK